MPIEILQAGWGAWLEAIAAAGGLVVGIVGIVLAIRAGKREAAAEARAQHEDARRLDAELKRAEAEKARDAANRRASFREVREKRRDALSTTIAVVRNALTRARNLISIGPDATFDSLIETTIAAMEAIHAMPGTGDVALEKWVHDWHIAEIDTLRRALVVMVLDVSRRPGRRAEADYQRRMAIYARLLALVRARTDEIASRYRVLRSATRVGPIDAVRLLLDSDARLEDIEASVALHENVIQSVCTTVT